MSVTNPARSKPATPQGFTQLAASGAFVRRVRGGSFVSRLTGGGRLKRWGIRLVAAVIALAVLWQLFLVAVGIATTDMWFNSVRAGSVYGTIIVTRIVLFCVFGAIAGAAGGLTFWAVRRIRPTLDVSPDYDTFRWMFRRYEARVWRLLLLLAVAVPAVLVGTSAAGGWQAYQLWANAAPFHSSDPVFHLDVSFFVAVLPFHQLVVSLLLQAVAYAIWIAVVAGYWYGTWRIRRGRRKVTRGIVQLVSLLVAGYLLLKAYNYWLSRYSLTTSPRGPVTGAGYTDLHATLPMTYALVGVMVIGAVALVLNAVRVGRLGRIGRVRVLAGVLVVLVILVQLLGSAVPGLVYHFREAPSASKLDLSEIAHNQAATRTAFGLGGNVSTVAYDSSSTTDASRLVQLAGSTAQASVIDPNQLSPSFNVLQQLQAYYGFKSTLDISHYELGGRSRDVALAARELQLGNIPSQTWVNSHLVYTHGYGVVAAPTTEVNATTSNPVFLNGGIPPSQDIPITRPQIYFGQGFGSGSYAIVGQPKGSTRTLEFDHPGSGGSSTSAYTTYEGNGGVPIGSAWRQFLFAVQFRSPNVLFSSEVNTASQLLEVRNPAARVAKVAPWLTLDGDVYPAVVNGHVTWVVDGYTTSSQYPDSQLVNLHKASATTLTANGASVAQPRRSVNYMQNSVKATVDAYTGRVTLYEWNQRQRPDPLLRTWESVFPHLVKPQSDIPPALVPQLRYPTDLFNVQRTLLAKYHVNSPASFYSGNDFWAVPTDPTVASANSINAKSGTAAASSPPLPSRYMSLSADGFSGERYALSSPMVTLNGRDLAAFISVNAEPGPDYGKFTVLDFPSSSGGESPSQVQNDIESDTTITEALTLQRGGNSKVVLGGLESIPVGGRILYVEPVYTQSNGGSSFPILRHVIALYGNGQPSFELTLSKAIANAITASSG